MSFDRLAPFYGAMEFFTAGGKLQRCRMAFLAEIPTPQRILIAGEGHGRFLPECVSRFPEAQIVVVDISVKMLKIARSKTQSQNVTFEHADFLHWNSSGEPFGLIVTNFFLDCFDETQLANVAAKLGRCATVEADWLVADFEIGKSRIAALRSRAILKMLYAFFRVVCGLRANALVPPDEAISRAGFLRVRRETYEWGLLKSEWWTRRRAL